MKTDPWVPPWARKETEMETCNDHGHDQHGHQCQACEIERLKRELYRERQESRRLRGALTGAVETIGDMLAEEPGATKCLSCGAPITSGTHCEPCAKFRDIG